MPRTFSGNWIVEFIYRQYILNWWINHFNFLRWGRHARNKEIKAPVLSGFPKYTDIYAKYFELPLEWLMGLVALTIVWEMTLFLTVWFLRCWVTFTQSVYSIHSSGMFPHLKVVLAIVSCISPRESPSKIAGNFWKFTYAWLKRAQYLFNLNKILRNYCKII